jgi:hypothetical protein
MQALGAVLRHYPDWMLQTSVTDAMGRSSSELNALVDNGVLERRAGRPVAYRVTEDFLKCTEGFCSSSRLDRALER